MVGAGSPCSRSGRGSDSDAPVTLRVRANDLLRLIDGSSVPCREELRSAFAAAPADVTATKPAIASELLPTYQVRLERWRREGLPPSVGLPEFLDALERIGEAE